jgi:predicted transporter
MRPVPRPSFYAALDEGQPLIYLWMFLGAYAATGLIGWAMHPYRAQITEQVVHSVGIMVGLPLFLVRAAGIYTVSQWKKWS